MQRLSYSRNVLKCLFFKCRFAASFKIFMTNGMVGCRALLLLALLCLFGTQGCGLFGSNKPAKFNIKSVSITTTARSNSDSSTRIEIAFAYSEELSKLISNMSAESWLQSREGLKASYGDKLVTYKKEMPPLSTAVVSLREQRRKRPHSVFMFVSMINANVNRINLEGRKGMLSLLVSEKNFALSEAK